jgi:hypothetical protein
MSAPQIQPDSIIELETPLIDGAQPTPLFAADIPIISAPHKRAFFADYDLMLDRTNGYDGQLAEAWRSATTYPLQDTVQAQPSVELEGKHLQEVNRMVATMKNAGISSAVIEAAHVYYYEDLDDPQLQESVRSQSLFAVALTDRLQEAGIATRHVLFVDDYNPDPTDGIRHNRLDIDELIELTQSTGYAPELLFREGDMVGLAKQMIRVMKDQGIIKITSEDEATEEEQAADPTTHLSHRNIELYRASDNMVSCAMIDAALTMVKFGNLGEGVVNVLPRRNDGQQFSYKGQQKKMRVILREHLGVRVAPIFNLFTGDTKTQDISGGAHHAFRKPH